MPRPEKVAIVEELADKLLKGQGVVLADYRGLSVKEITALRSELRKVGVEFKVVKNTLTRLAARKADLEELESVLVGPTAIAFGYDDQVAVAKAISDFAKKNDKLKVKGGVVDGKVIDVEGVEALAKLPSKPELLAQVLRGMQAPIGGLVNVLHGVLRNLVYVLEAVRKQKEEAA
jgi:large subunit ribosomal protein L10